VKSEKKGIRKIGSNA
jgi:hypothetical protein